MTKKYTIYSLIFMFSLVALILPGYLVSAKRNFRVLSRASSINPATPQKTFSSCFRPLPNGYVLVLYAGKQKGYDGAQFIIINNFNSEITVELIKGAGISNVSLLVEEEATNFLTESQILLDAFKPLAKTKL